jgi:WXXGXW repeat (2 copies)
MRSLIILLAVLSAFSANAQTDRTVIDREPPTPIYEVMPSEQPGYVWTPGYWHPDNRKRLVWSSGRLVKDRPGYKWIPSGWVNSADKWYFVKGVWEADETFEVVEEDAELSPPNDTQARSRTKVLKKKLPRKINYADTKRWPRVTQH